MTTNRYWLCDDTCTTDCGVCKGGGRPADSGEDPLRDALRIHHPIMRSETGPFSGCRCGQVRLGQDVIAHVVTELRAALDGAA